MLQQRTSRTVLAIAWCAAWVLAQAQPRAVRSSPQQPSTRPAPYHLALNWAKLNDEAIEKLSQYIRLVTLNPPGMESKGVEWLKKVFEAEGIAYEVAEAAHGRGNIVARLKGAAPASQQRGLILLSHIDVVPVNHEFWTVDPFSGEVRDGYIWGRGAIDMKAQAIAQLMAFLLLHRAKLPLNRDVIFLATADEEAGGE
jgi:acetylornithine deacetylase/succinyl-diaminopimelate desuccinylase-like protein